MTTSSMSPWQSWATTPAPCRTHLISRGLALWRRWRVRFRGVGRGECGRMSSATSLRRGTRSPTRSHANTRFRQSSSRTTHFDMRISVSRLSWESCGALWRSLVKTASKQSVIRFPMVGPGAVESWTPTFPPPLRSPLCLASCRLNSRPFFSFALALRAAWGRAGMAWRPREATWSWRSQTGTGTRSSPYPTASSTSSSSAQVRKSAQAIGSPVSGAPFGFFSLASFKPSGPLVRGPPR